MTPAGSSSEAAQTTLQTQQKAPVENSSPFKKAFVELTAQGVAAFVESCQGSIGHVQTIELWQT